MAKGSKVFLARLERFGRRAENAALVVLLSSMILLAVGQIVLRELFSTGFIWADELVKLMVLWLAMVGSIAASSDDRHIRIDALSHILPERLVNVTRMVVDLFAAAVCAVIAWHAWRYLQLEIDFGDDVLINTPAWIAHAIMPIAFSVISFRFLVLALKRVNEIFTGPSQSVAE